MLNFYLRFLLKFCFIIHILFGLIIPDNSLVKIRNRCKSNWHYLSEDETCIIFATTYVGDISWDNSSKACQENSGKLLTISNFLTIKSIERKINENNKYFDLMQRGTWIGETIRLDDENLCDTINDDHQLNCIILTIHLNNQTLCLKKVSCIENHPFICQTRAMTEEEEKFDDENAMQRVDWWKCFIPIWCIIDYVQESNEQKKKEEDAAAAAATAASAATELQSYLDQFVTNMPDRAMMNINQQAFIAAQEQAVALKDSQNSNWLFWFGGGLIILLVICTCCVAIICVYKKVKKRNMADYRASTDSTYSK